MKLFITLLSFFTLLFSPIKIEASPTSFARSYVLMEQNTGTILQGKNYNLVRSVASVSKIMTAIVALESEKLYDVVTIEESDIKTIGSSIYLKVGNKITVLELVYGLMLRSGNDAGLALSRYLTLKNKSFIETMNDYAKKIGMLNSTFNNPTGLDIDETGNLSTAYDLALLMRYSMQNDYFKTIVSTKEYRSILSTWSNKNKLLKNYEYCTGGKTGFTAKARRTLVTSASKDNFNLIAVTLDCGDDFSFHRTLYNYYFENYAYVEVLKAGYNIIDGHNIKVNTDVGIILKKNNIASSTLLYTIYKNQNYLTVYLIQYNIKTKIGQYKIL